MNYLAHVMLALPHQDVVAGSFLADHIKGGISALPDLFRDGVDLHRKIDRFVDEHPMVMESKRLIRPTYGRYAGILIDIFYDHFLSKHWGSFTCFPFEEVSSFTYLAVKRYPQFVPESFTVAVERLEAVKWLEGYGTMDGIRSSLKRVSVRGKRRHPLENADSVLIRYYNEIECHFLGCMPQVREYAVKLLS